MFHSATQEDKVTNSLIKSQFTKSNPKINIRNHISQISQKTTVLAHYQQSIWNPTVQQNLFIEDKTKTNKKSREVLLKTNFLKTMRKKSLLIKWSSL